jgi:hypothetical protein
MPHEAGRTDHHRGSCKRNALGNLSADADELLATEPVVEARTGAAIERWRELDAFFAGSLAAIRGVAFFGRGLSSDAFVGRLAAGAFTLGGSGVEILDVISCFNRPSSASA